MPIETVQMYRVVCDETDCKDSPQDHGDYHAWADPGYVIDEAVDQDWYVSKESDEQRLLCPEHAPKCACTGCGACKTYPDGNCKVSLRDDEFGAVCEDCFIEAEEPTSV